MTTDYSAYQAAQDTLETDIRTLFITGLPVDVREREIHNLFRLVKGYEGCKLILKPGKAPVAFATFLDRDSASVGQAALQVSPSLSAFLLSQGVRFDPEQIQSLRIEFAKSNSKTKRLLDDRM